MTRLLHVAGLATTLISPIQAVAQTRYTCGPGVVQSVHRDPQRLAAGDPVRVCVNGIEMVLEAGDATDYRAPLANTGALPERPAASASRSRF